MGKLYALGVVYKFRDVHTHQAVPIPPGEHLIGREDVCAVHIENTSVSRRHAKITNTEEGVWIEDLGSSNGTAIRGQAITERTAIEVGEVVYFGTACFRLEPEIPGEEPTPAPQPGLKPAGLRNLMRKTTDRVPLASIRFDDVPVPTSLPPETAVAPMTAPAESPVAASEPQLAPVKSAAREKISTYPTITLPANRPPTSVSAPVPPVREVVSPAPVATQREVERTPEIEEREPSVSWMTTLWMAFGSGLAAGILTGIGIAYYLFAVARNLH